MNDTCKERIGNRDYVTFGADTEIPYGLLSTDSNRVIGFKHIFCLSHVVVGWSMKYLGR